MIFSTLALITSPRSRARLRIPVASKLTIALVFACGGLLITWGMANQLKYKSEIANHTSAQKSLERLSAVQAQTIAHRIASLEFLLSGTDQQKRKFARTRARLTEMLVQASADTADHALSQEFDRLLARLTAIVGTTSQAGILQELAEIVDDAHIRASKREKASLRRLDSIQNSNLRLITISSAAVFLLSAAFALHSRHQVSVKLRTRYLEHIAVEKQRSDLLARELSHRVKNLFAVILSIIAATARGEADATVAAQKTRDRVSALARAHALTNRSDGVPQAEADTVGDLIETIIHAYRPPDGLMTCIGDDVVLHSEMITPLSLIFNELATNAMKYGAWSQNDGEVEVTVTGNTDNTDLASIEWVERGGPPPKDPAIEALGFGTRMLGASVSQLLGRLERRWTPTGLEVSILFSGDEPSDE